MPSIPRWRGSSDLTESPESPVITYNKDGLVYVKTFSGPHAACVAAMPNRFSMAAGVPSSLKVDTIEVKKLPGGKGVLTITFNPSPIPDPNMSENSSIHEIEWSEVQRPLAQHARYNTGGSKALSDTDWTRIKGWQAETSEYYRSDFKFWDEKSNSVLQLSDDAKEYCQKLLRGQESYNEYTPIARLTTSSIAKPTTGACGTIATSPPVDGIPSGYKWLKTADRACKRSYKWERVQEWTGTWWWDTDLYAEL